MLLRDLEQHDEKNDSLLGNNFETTPVNLGKSSENIPFLPGEISSEF